MTDQVWPNPGRPLPAEDYQDPRTSQQRDTDRVGVIRQVANLVRRREDQPYRRELVRTLRQRRAGAPGWWSVAGCSAWRLPMRCASSGFPHMWLKSPPG